MLDAAPSLVLYVLQVAVAPEMVRKMSKELNGLKFQCNKILAA